MTAPTTNSQMYQTIHRQPDDLRRLLGEGWEQAVAGADLVSLARRVVLVGTGTSWHAAMVGGWLLRAAGADARAVHSFDFATYPDNFPITVDDAVIVMAHTGVTSYSGLALRRAVDAGATVLSVGSAAAEHPGSHLVLRTTAPETSAAYTASHLAAMTVLAQVATEIGERRDAPATAGFRDALTGLPDAIAGLLARQAEVTPVAREAIGRRIYAAGAGPNEATALEVVIKVREAAYGWIDALAAEQFLHGPMCVVNPDDMAIFIHVPGAGAQRVAEIAGVARAMGARLWIVGEEVLTAPDALTFGLPPMPELLSPLTAVVPMQLLAYEMAAAKGVNPDTFREDDPRYKAAFGLLGL
jgi:glutamine---fructose-6-phosphate transaminase (isomerizing)